MNRKGIFRLAVLLSLTQPLLAIKVPQGFADCSSLEACLQLLDEVVPAHDNGEGSNADILANGLHRFGVPAKQELLKRANGEHPGWRNVAGAILSEWHSWTASDVPALHDALRKDPGGWVARPLGEIGTPDAIRALVEDLPKGSGNQTDFALTQLGSRAIPYLFPVLESEKNAASAARIISEIGAAAVPFASNWAALANNPDKPLRVRLAALRGIAAVGDMARPSCKPLHSLLDDSDPKVRTQARITFRAVRDSVVIEDVLRSCHPTASAFDPLALKALTCLEELASFGGGAHEVGSAIAPFLKSGNGTERSYAITTLGWIGYEASVPQIENALESADWREVYAAIRSLGWLGDTSGTPAINKVASTHWLPEVRAKAKEVGEELTSKGHVSRPSRFARFAEEGGEPFVIDRDVLYEVAPCASSHWEWNGTVFGTPSRSERDIELQLPDGKFVGTNHGEWGGKLTWKSANGQVQGILSDNVVAIEPDIDGPVVLLGLAHMGLAYGYAIHLTHASGGSWKVIEIGRLPAEASAGVGLGPDLFAALSGGRVVIFSAQQGILGLATCKVF